jgi:hypothetical protein
LVSGPAWGLSVAQAQRVASASHGCGGVRGARAGDDARQVTGGCRVPFRASARPVGGDALTCWPCSAARTHGGDSFLETAGQVASHPPRSPCLVCPILRYPICVICEDFSSRVERDEHLEEASSVAAGVKSVRLEQEMYYSY